MGGEIRSIERPDSELAIINELTGPVSELVISGRLRSACSVSPSADASARGSPVTSAPDASAWYSRERALGAVGAQLQLALLNMAAAQAAEDGFQLTIAPGLVRPEIMRGDVGTAAARKYDCEAWVPTQQAYRELTSTSNCTTFQARRLSIRYRDADGKPQTAATLNGTLATTRWIDAILESHQQSDGSIRVPEAMRPYLGGRET